MVALKLAGSMGGGSGGGGSRNAVVALKQLRNAIGVKPRRGKQERRGGIETAVRRLSPSSIHMKQERRGGIETVDKNVSVRAALGGKQERRGGIETELLNNLLESLKNEAGTPWWH